MVQPRRSSNFSVHEQRWVQHNRAIAKLKQEVEELLEREPIRSRALELLQQHGRLRGRHVLAEVEQHRVQRGHGHSRGVVVIVLLEHALELVDLLGRELLQEAGRDLVAHADRVMGWPSITPDTKRRRSE